MTASRAVPQKAWVSPASENKRSEFTRFSFGLGLSWLLVIAIAMALAPRTGNGYATFGTLWASGNAAAHGLNPYTHYPQTFHAPDYSAWDLNLNPPWTLPFVQALSHLSIEDFKKVWTLLTFLCFLGGCLILIRYQPELQGRQILWIAICDPVLATFDEGQVYAWPFLFAALAWMFHKTGRYVAAGIAVGFIVALRPTMGLWILLLLLTNHRRVGIVSAVTVAALYALPLLIYGPAIYAQYAAAFVGDKHWLDPLNIGIIPFSMRLGHPYLGRLLAVAVAAFGCWWTARNKPNFTIVSGLGICLGILCAPLAWFRYILFVAPFFMSQRWSIPATIAALFFFMRGWVHYEPLLGFLYLAATVLIAYSIVGLSPTEYTHMDASALRLNDRADSGWESIKRL